MKSLNLKNGNIIYDFNKLQKKKWYETSKSIKIKN